MSPERRPSLRCLHCDAPWPAGSVPRTCPGCGRETLFIDEIPVLVRDLDSVQAQIREAESSARAPWYGDPQAVMWTGPYRHHVSKRVAYVEDAIRRFAPGDPSERLGLDAGCGDGEHHPWLAQHVGVLHASDYNLVRLRRAAERGLAAEVFLGDLTDYPAVDEAYDVVFCNHVLEHIEDDVQALRELRRVLRPGGIAIVGVPNEGAFFWRLAYRLEPESRRSTDHIHFHTASTLESRCRAAGFAVREVHPIGWGLPHWTLDARVRGVRAVDDALEAVGRRFLRSQATSLYAVLAR